MSACACVNDRPGINGGLPSATYVSINSPAGLQRGAKFCPVPDLWPRGAFLLTRSNWIHPEHLWYSHLPGPACCPTENEPRVSASTCTDLHLPAQRPLRGSRASAAAPSPSEELSTDGSRATCEGADVPCDPTTEGCAYRLSASDGSRQAWLVLIREAL